MAATANSRAWFPLLATPGACLYKLPSGYGPVQCGIVAASTAFGIVVVPNEERTGADGCKRFFFVSQNGQRSFFVVHVFGLSMWRCCPVRLCLSSTSDGVSPSLGMCELELDRPPYSLPAFAARQGFKSLTVTPCMSTLATSGRHRSPASRWMSPPA